MILPHRKLVKPSPDSSPLALLLRPDLELVRSVSLPLHNLVKIIYLYPFRFFIRLKRNSRRVGSVKFIFISFCAFFRYTHHPHVFLQNIHTLLFSLTLFLLPGGSFAIIIIPIYSSPLLHTCQTSLALLPNDVRVFSLSYVHF